MESRSLCDLFLLSLIISTVTAVAAVSSSSRSVLRIVPPERPSGRRDDADALFCDSWRLSVEAYNARFWSTIPSRCAGFVEEYMNGPRYASDFDVVASEALDFARSVVVAGDGKDVWIFDIDETLLSNLPYYASIAGYGSYLWNHTAWDEWVLLASAPALSASLKLYKELQGLGFQIILLTGRDESQRNLTESNLLFAGYHSWERLILRQASDTGKPAIVYKSKKRAELEAQGFRIHGNSGDQWSDLLGLPSARRSFKLPNPMYYLE